MPDFLNQQYLTCIGVSLDLLFTEAKAPSVGSPGYQSPPGWRDIFGFGDPNLNLHGCHLEDHSRARQNPGVAWHLCWVIACATLRVAASREAAAWSCSQSPNKLACGLRWCRAESQGLCRAHGEERHRTREANHAYSAAPAPLMPFHGGKNWGKQCSQRGGRRHHHCQWHHTPSEDRWVLTMVIVVVP